MGGGRLEVVDECLAADAVDRHPFEADEPDMRAHLKGAITMLRGAMPDLSVTVEDLLAEGNQVAARVILRGTHTGGPLFGRPASGARPSRWSSSTSSAATSDGPGHHATRRTSASTSSSHSWPEHDREPLQARPAGASLYGNSLVDRQRRVDLVDPADDAALHVHGVAEAGALQHRQRLRRADAGLAVQDDLLVLRQLGERDAVRISPFGISTAPGIWTISYSAGSRTSTR